MSELSERKLVYEILVERAGRWNVVDVMDNREDALALGEKLRSGHAAVRVTIERFDPETRLYTTVTLWEWQATKAKGHKGPTVARVEVAPRLHHSKPPVSKKPVAWWRRLLGLS